jgi:RNA polymerase sigma-70 factor (ECF subfamily)
MSQPCENEWIREALAGDQAGYEALYRAYLPLVCAAVGRHTTCRDEHEDLVQITFMRAFQALPTFRGDSAFSTWITQIALNACRSHIRSRRAQRECFRAVEESDPALPLGGRAGRGEDPEQAVLRMEQKELVRRGIRSLPKRYREAMWMRYVKDRSYHEIVQALQVPMGTVKTWLSRARHQLRGQLSKPGLRAA